MSSRRARSAPGYFRGKFAGEAHGEEPVIDVKRALKTHSAYELLHTEACRHGSDHGVRPSCDTFTGTVED